MSDLGLEGVPGVELVGVMPHMHQLGQKYHMTVTNDSRDAVCAADIASWDFQV